MSSTPASKKSSYKILGVDPGTNIMGFAVLEVQGSTLKILNFGVFHLEKYENHHEKLKEIFLQLQEIIETYLPSVLAIEAPFYGNNVQSMLKLGRAQGVAMDGSGNPGIRTPEGETIRHRKWQCVQRAGSRNAGVYTKNQNHFQTLRCNRCTGSRRMSL